MGWFTGIVVFLIAWWTFLLMVLPFGHKRDIDGTVMPGANIKKKFIWTTIGAAVIWVIIYLIIEADVISFQDMAQAMFEEDALK
ncbi:MAG: DUF1467 family protein [Alphaproteobacteria bacterium]|nr:DUF1467 family protein [Alphaproteobacteria bacterium]